MSSHCLKTLVASCVVLLFLGGAACTSPATQESAPEKVEARKAPEAPSVAPSEGSPAPVVTAETPKAPEIPQEAKEVEPKPAPAVKEAPPPTPLSPECSALLEQIRGLDKHVAFVFDRVKDQNQLNQDMVKATEACRRFISEC